MTFPQEKSALTATNGESATKQTHENASNNLPTNGAERNCPPLPGDPAWEQAEAAIAVGWDVHVVDHLLAPTCPSCGGACFIRDCGVDERCELCEGEGVLR